MLIRKDSTLGQKANDENGMITFCSKSRRVFIDLQIFLQRVYAFH